MSLKYALCVPDAVLERKRRSNLKISHPREKKLAQTPQPFFFWILANRLEGVQFTCGAMSMGKSVLGVMRSRRHTEPSDTCSACDAARGRDSMPTRTHENCSSTPLPLSAVLSACRGLADKQTRGHVTSRMIAQSLVWCSKKSLFLDIHVLKIDSRKKNDFLVSVTGFIITYSYITEL